MVVESVPPPSTSDLNLSVAARSFRSMATTTEVSRHTMGRSVQICGLEPGLPCPLHCPLDASGQLLVRWGANHIFQEPDGLLLVRGQSQYDLRERLALSF